MRSIFISTLFLIGALIGAPAAPAAINGFEGGDGDQLAACAAVRDWQCVPADAIITGTDASGATDVGFAGGSKETEPDKWLFTQDAVQGKADVRGAWGVVEPGNSGRTYLHVGFLRGSGNGDTYVGIELNQVVGAWTNTAGSTIPCRTDGDLLLSYEASQKAVITIYRWDGAGGPAGCPDGRTGAWTTGAASSQPVFEAAMNSAAIVNHVAPASFGQSFATGTFGEASVDLGTLAELLGGSGSGCSYFRKMSVKTRSAASLDSSLQDWAQGSELFARSCGAPDPAGDVTPPAVPSVNAAASACTLPLAVTGTTEPGATVTVYDGLRAAGFAVADGSGAWQLSLASLTEGTHSISAEATDFAGNTSARSGAVPVAYDATAPAAPVLHAQRAGAGMVDVWGTAEAGREVTIRDGEQIVATVTAGPGGSFATTLVGVDMQGHTYTATVADACRTSAASAPASVADVLAPQAPSLTVAASTCTLPLTVSGTGEPGTTVRVFDGANQIGSALVAGSGAWTLSVATLTDGTHSLSADAVDASDNVSNRSSATPVTVDTTAPAAPVLNAARSGAGMVTLSGTAEPGSQVAIREGATLVATVTAAADGTFSTTIDSVSADVEHVYVATASDACRTSPASAPASVGDATAPPAPTLTSAPSSCQLPLVVSGSSEPGATVTVRDGSDAVGSTVAGDTGEWQLSLNSLSDGPHTLTAVARDAAGNVSVASAETAVRIDTTAPAAPLLDADRGDGDTVELSGTAEPGSDVVIREGDDVVARVTAASDGSFSATLTDVTAGAHEYVAVAEDDCRSSSQSAPAAVGPLPDTTAPAAPSVSAAAAACSLPLTVSGQSEPGATVTVVEGTTPRGDAVADAAGAWSLDLATLPDGPHSLAARARDAAGNLSASSAPVTVTVDTTGPAAPVLQATRVDAGTIRLSGTAEAGLPLTVREGDRVVASAEVAGDGTFSKTLTDVAAGDHSYVASVSDGCRTSAASAAATVPGARTGEEPPPTGTTPTGTTPTGTTPTGTTPTGTTPTGTTPVAPVAPTSDVADPEFEMGTKTVVRECMNKAFRAYITRKGVRRARFYVDGKLARTVRKPDARGFFVTTIDPARYAPGAHALTARVTFRKARKRPVTLKLRFRRCDECRSRRSFRIRVPHLRDGERAVRAQVFVNGKRVKVLTGKRLRARVVLRGLPRGTYKVRIVARTNRGRIHRSTRTYRTCVGKSPASKRAPARNKRG